jgi:hypothetical protein
MILAKEASIGFKWPCNHPSCRLKCGIHMNLPRHSPNSLRRRQAQEHGTEIQPRMPLPYPAKSENGTSYQIELYQVMNTSACPENFE